MSIYIILACVYIIFIFFEKIIFLKMNKKLWISILILPIFILIGFRNFNIGTDTISYKWLYTTFSNVSLFGGNNYNIEFGYRMINKVSSIFGIDFFGFQIIYSIFISIVLLRFILKYSKNISFSIFIFITYRTLFVSMNILRQTIAASIFLIGLKYIERREWKKYVLIVIIASTIHLSAILLLSFYFIPFKKIDLKSILKVLIVNIIIVIIIFDKFVNLIIVFFPKYYSYLNRMNNSDGLYITLQICIITIFLLFGILVDSRAEIDKIKNIKVKERNEIKERIVTNGMIFSYGLTILALKFNIMGRLIRYFSIFLIIYIPNKIEKVKNIKIKLLLYIIFISFFMIYFIVIMKMRPNWDNVIPYEFI